MSKSKGVVVTPMPLVNQFGADAVRYWASNGRPGMDMAFDETVFTIGGKLVTKLYNAGKFVLMQEAEHGEITTELDRAFVHDLRETVQRATNAFENYEFAHALQITETFFWDAFADNYIELVKRRARSETDPQGRSSAVATLRLGLNTLLRLFAPFVPTITDEVWSWTFAQETGHPSIHLAPWPDRPTAQQEPDTPAAPVRGKTHRVDAGPVNFHFGVSPVQITHVPSPTNSNSFQTACRAIAAVRKAKHEAQIGLGKPLATLTITATQDQLEVLNLVANDVSDAGGAPQITYNPVESDDGYIATVEAPTD